MMTPNLPIFDAKAEALSRAKQAVKLETVINSTDWHKSVASLPFALLKKHQPSTQGLWETALETSIQGDGAGIKFLSKLVLALRTVNDVLNYRLASDAVCEDLYGRFDDTIDIVCDLSNSSAVLKELLAAFDMTGDESGSVFLYKQKPVITYASGTFKNWNELRSNNFVKLPEMTPEAQIATREALLELFEHARYENEFLTKGAPKVYPSIEGFLPYSAERVDFEMKSLVQEQQLALEQQCKDEETFGVF